MILSQQGPFAMCWHEKWSKIHGLIVRLINWWIGCWEPELPKVVKVSHLTHIHPLACQASPSAKQRQAAKTNTCRSPGRLFFRGHLHSSRLTAGRARAHVRETNPVSVALERNSERDWRKVVGVIAVDAAHRHHRSAWKTRGRGPRSLQEVFSFRR